MLELAGYVTVIIVLVYTWLTWNHNHWKKLKIPYIEPNIFFGNVKDFVLMKKTKGLVYHELYRQSTEPAVGMFSMRQPQLLIRDPGLVKMLTINEFSNFRENDIYTEPSDFFFSTNIFFFSGEKWKKDRATITPALSMAKVKLFMPHLVEICREMIQHLDANIGNPIEAKAFTGLYTIETAMSYVYGVKCDAFNNPHSKYRQAFDEIFIPSWWNGFLFTIATVFPVIGHFFKIGLTPKSFASFYLQVVKETVEYRKKNNFSRKDFLQCFIDAGEKSGGKELSIRDITGLTMNVAADATETTSAGLTHVIDALIRYPEAQAKLREEIDSKINSLDDITYENVSSFKYMPAFISESLRILTPVPLLEKKCTSDCEVTFNGKKYKFKKNDKFAYPIHSIHHNPKFFPEPEKFDPSRFLKGEELLGFYTFGSGPRSCIGRTFAYFQMKVFLTAILSTYEVLPKDGVAPPQEFEINSSFFLMLKGGVWFRLKRRQI